MTAIYNKEIYSYQIDKSAYVMYYVYDGTDYYYGPVKNRAIMDILNETYPQMGSKGQLVIDAMKNLFETVVAYRNS